ncbi:hypothetical protein CVS40_11235 [Lucilia cuprina]|nr:hypothetical protein CVS40_11235 [Lucilia cuprina]
MSKQARFNCVSKGYTNYAHKADDPNCPCRSNYFKACSRATNKKAVNQRRQLDAPIFNMNNTNFSNLSNSNVHNSGKQRFAKQFFLNGSALQFSKCKFNPEIKIMYWNVQGINSFWKKIQLQQVLKAKLSPIAGGIAIGVKNKFKTQICPNYQTSGIESVSVELQRLYFSEAKLPTVLRSHDNWIFAPERPESYSAKDCQPSDSCINRNFYLWTLRKLQKRIKKKFPNKSLLVWTGWFSFKRTFSNVRSDISVYFVAELRMICNCLLLFYKTCIVLITPNLHDDFFHVCPNVCFHVCR